MERKIKATSYKLDSYLKRVNNIHKLVKKNTTATTNNKQTRTVKSMEIL